MFAHRTIAACVVAVCLSLSTSLCADAVFVLDTDADSAQCRTDIVQRAGDQILASYFIFADDTTGLGALWQLREARRRGVTVRIIIDSLYNRVRPAVVAHLLSEGVEVRLYHKPTIGRPLRWTRRMHDKLLIVDGRQLITGGRNIEEPYFGRSEHRNYVDRDIYVEGATAAGAQRYFLDLWDSHHVGPPKKHKISQKKLQQAVADLDDAGLRMASEERVKLDTENDWSARGVAVDNVRFFHDPVTRRRKKQGIREDLIPLIRGASESVVVETPYLVPSKLMFRELRAARERGVQIRMLTNSLKVADSLWAQSGYVGKRKKLVRIGVELWEYSGPRTLHAKSVVIDGKVALIGSYNLDPRSRKLNSEVAVVVDDSRIADDTADSMRRNLEHAWRIGPDGRPEGEEMRYPGTTRGRRFKVYLLRLFLPLTKRQL